MTLYHYLLHLTVETDGPPINPGYLVDVIMSGIDEHNARVKRYGTADDDESLNVIAQISEPWTEYRNAVVVTGQQGWFAKHDDETWTSIETCRLVEYTDDDGGRLLFRF